VEKGGGGTQTGEVESTKIREAESTQRRKVEEAVARPEAI
jgi:hypothetical protein